MALRTTPLGNDPSVHNKLQNMMMTEGAVIPQEKFYSALLEHHRVECDETTARQVASKIPVEIMERIVEMYGGASGGCVSHPATCS